MRTVLVILLSILAAYVLAVMPLPDMVGKARPEWVVMVMVYWTIALPHRVGVLTGWVVGLLLDSLEGLPLGVNALAMAIVIYFAAMLHRRIRLYPLWQQAMIIFLLVGLYQAIIHFVSGLIRLEQVTVVYWLPSVASAILWPWFMLLLRYVRRYYRAS